LIFFLVNNDYQLFDARHHARELSAAHLDSSLIEVPHALRETDRGRGFASVTTFPSPLRSHGWIGAWLRYFPAARRVARELRPTDRDVLFFYTEFDLVNHFIVRRFKRARARVFLLEDGGVGTYLPFSIEGNEALDRKQRIVAAMTRRLPGLRRTRFHKVNGVVFPWLPDASIDAVCLYRPLSIVRALPVQVLRRPSREAIVAKAGRVVFLNERMYDDYQSDEQYLEGLALILDRLVAGFPEVLFKFHPRETGEWRQRIRATIASRFPAVQLIESERPIEVLLAEQRPEVLASYFSTTLLNLAGTGIEPMFLFQMLPDLANQRLFVQLAQLLSQWNCRLVRHWDEVRSGYESGLDDDAAGGRVSVADLVERSDASGIRRASAERHPVQR